MKYSAIKIGTSEKLDIPKFQFFEPRRNLPRKSSRKNRERDFTLKFARTYLSQIESLHHKTTKTSIACAREIPINGFGIADLVTVAWDENKIQDKFYQYDSDIFIKSVKPTMRAFELKISNWRRAIMQASRYKFFANVSIVVLPVSECVSPLKYLDTFKKIRIGLWGFDQSSNRIVPFFTPKPNKPNDTKHQLSALALVAKASKSLPIS